LPLYRHAIFPSGFRLSVGRLTLSVCTPLTPALLELLMPSHGAQNLFHRIAYSLLVVILVCISIISSFLLSFSADITRIRSTNPALLINLILFCLKIKRIL
ncbi:MAG: hypothetical protein WCA79_13290, partial [Anaerolineales bacterium]